MVIVVQHIKITILTISSFALGLCAFDIQSILLTIVRTALLLAFIYTLPIILVFLKIFSQLTQSTNQIFTYTLTTFIFGIIDYISYIYYYDLVSVFLIVRTIYHYGEFQLINVYHHNQLKWFCFLIYHSKEYTIANIGCIIEHILTKYYFEFKYKRYHVLVIPSFIMMCIGLISRILAFYTAKSNFTHLIQYQKKHNHVLVTNGIYSIIRHPSYFGFFYFTLGTMLYIGNIFCFFAYLVILQRFFTRRIQIQEQTLIQFFGEKYIEYRKKTPTLIPFIK